MRFAVCDDDRALLNDISSRIALLYPGAVIDCFTSGEELLSSENAHDIIFLDIDMPGKNGMETAGELRKKGSRAVLIFLTAFESYVFDAFDVGAFHYLLKPVSGEKFHRVLSSAVKSRENVLCEESEVSKRSVTIRSGGVSSRILLSDIVYAEVFNRKITLHTENGSTEYYGRLSALEAKAGKGFFRSHRAYLVNLAYISSYTSSEITLETGETLLLAKDRYQSLVKSYLDYVKGSLNDDK